MAQLISFAQLWAVAWIVALFEPNGCYVKCQMACF